MSCPCEMKMVLQSDAGLTSSSLVLVSDDLQSPCLVSWHDLLRLGLIPKGFPHSVVQEVQIDGEGLKEEFLRTFPDVISDELGFKAMEGPPIDIHLKKNAVPHKVFTTKAVPLHWKRAADEMVTDLLKKRIITRVPVNQPTDWVAGGFFVPKPGGKKLRLVTNYKPLNKYVKRPTHPFPSSRDILQAIGPEAKVFCKLDLLHGYFQCELSEEASLLTTFLLPSGRYRYLRLPMGMSASSDVFCHGSDRLIEGLDWANKIVDDILIYASSYAELYVRVEEVLERARQFNVTISKSKFEIGEKIEFAGFLISAGGIFPAPSQVECLKKFPSPKNITELRSFLGLANQLGWFIPDLCQATAGIRQLLKKQKKDCAEASDGKAIIYEPNFQSLQIYLGNASG